jgi:hypothetical protein
VAPRVAPMDQEKRRTANTAITATTEEALHKREKLFE